MTCYRVQFPDGSCEAIEDQRGVTHVVVALSAVGWQTWAGFGERYDAAAEQVNVLDRPDVQDARIVDADIFYPTKETDRG